MVERPRVVWDALLVRPGSTGVGRSILELARAMSAQDRGFAFTVLTTHPEMFSCLEGVPHWQLLPCPAAAGGTLRKAIFTQFRLPGLVRRLEGQLLHSLQFVGPVWIPCLHVVTVHDLSYRRYPHTVEQPRRAYYRLFVPHTLRRSSQIVTNSEATARDVATAFPSTAGRITATPFGTPTWVWKQPPVGADRPPDAPFLFVGTLEPRKNLQRLLTAYELFLEHCNRREGSPEPPELVLVGGKGWRDAALGKQIRLLQEKGKLRLEGFCGPERLWNLYGSARALLFPSLHEGFGFPILEAMAANLPVLTADRGAMREVAGDAALMVDPEDPEDIAKGMEK